ncbi:hypothetical protein LOTGIDRAFT_223159 [Lottia gigantea]|uniref:Thiopurine S-methyltransferase n=1 Tax=Lottia gigantea TaxID=225164 RepID=V4B3P4_LOTGI|nr:hypothetical protein LOTGIDRAFT_223159 [Lottia gigantea]ESO82999.1 hypothetical protein LOTGIDRAFT_223159 [Lottia gigantea]
MAATTDSKGGNEAEKCEGPGQNFWVDFWKSDEGRECYLQKPHECLIKFEDKLFKGRNGVKTFVPMCGKTFDLISLKQKGHQVVGVEISEDAVKHFFELNKLDYNVTPEPSIDGKLYQSECGKIKIYVGDFFKFGPHLEKDFDAVWDAGALHSLGKPKRPGYVDVLKSVISPECEILFDDLVPSCSDQLSVPELESLFGSGYKVDALGFTKTEYEFYKSWEAEGFNMFHVHK